MRSCNESHRQNKRRISKFHSAITLIEVVVGLAMLGTMLTVILVASGKLEGARRIAEHKLAAVEMLDGLVAIYQRDGFPESGFSERMPGNSYLRLHVVRRSWQQSPEHFEICRVWFTDEQFNSLLLASAEMLLQK